MLLILQLLKYGQPHVLALTFSLLSRIINQAGTIAMLVIAGRFADQLLTAGTDALFFPHLILPLLAVGVIKAIFRYLEQISGHHAAFAILEDLRRRIYWKLEQKSPGNIGRLSSGDLVSRVVSDIERVEVFYAHTIVPVLSAVLVSILVVIADWLLFDAVLAAGHALLLLLTGLVIPWGHYRWQSRAGVRLRQDFARMNTCLTDVVNGTEEIQNWRSMAFFRSRTYQQGEALQSRYDRLALNNGLKDGMTDMVIGAGFLGLLLMAWLGDGSRALSLSHLCLYAASFGPVLALTRTFEDLVQTIPCCKRVLSLLAQEEQQQENAQDMVLLSDKPLLDIRDARFSHDDQAPVLHGCTMQIKAGEYHLLHGESGSGKTTLLRLLAGIWAPQQGDIRFCGQRLSSGNRDSFWQQVSYVPQQAVIFPASLRHNLCLGLEVSDDRLLQLLDWVCLTPMLNRMESGLDTQMGLNGTRVSGGEGQRIALARAILRDTPVYLLDEAFSALDRETELAVRANLEPFFKDRAVVEISHRPLIDLNRPGVADRFQQWTIHDGTPVHCGELTLC